MKDTRVRLSTLWVFMLFNFLYADVMALFDPVLTGSMTREALLAASVIMEVPIVMVPLSRMLMYRPNRWANMAAALFMAVVQGSSMIIGGGTIYYLFYTAIEIPCLLFIIWTAWRWAEPVDAAA
jgi:hypothetical protein